MIPLRSTPKYLFVYLLFATGILWLAKRRVVRRRAVGVLTLHRVLPEAEFRETSSLPGTVVRDRTFDALARYLRRHCAPVDLSAGLACEIMRKRPGVAVTFDDGYADVGAVASPIAWRHGLPITIFLCPGLMERFFPFWPERAVAARRFRNGGTATGMEAFVEELKNTAPGARNQLLARMPQPPEGDLRQREPMNATLGWKDLPALAKRGVSFGSHTQSHPILTQLTMEETDLELSESKRALESQLGETCPALAYPNGSCSTAVRNAALQAGFKLAFTTRTGLWTEDCDPLLVPRINISEARITGPLGNFSQAMFEYYVFWRGLRAKQAD